MAIYQSFLHALIQCGLTRQRRVVRQRSDAAVRLFTDGSVSVLHQDGNPSEKISTTRRLADLPEAVRRVPWKA